ncbi:MAG: hypothetical protein J07HN4v3_01360 [Halonotius sp. J07HN4]|nr:MAG: hypothetical protein J07HN4v3_01360 [Halonotius sp. J07HN4]
MLSEDKPVLSGSRSRNRQIDPETRLGDRVLLLCGLGRIHKLHTLGCPRADDGLNKALVPR